MMKRSTPLRSRGFSRPAHPERETMLMVPVRGGQRGVYAPASEVVVRVPKEVAAKPGKRAPTVAEAEWMANIVSLGCIACLLDGCQPRPTAVHHILRGGRRIGHLFTLPLCQPGHHMDGGHIGLVSRHPFKARFEAMYGKELDLLEIVRKKVLGDRE